MADTSHPGLRAEPLKKSRSRNARSKKTLEDFAPLYTHADYNEWRDIWRSIRHAMIGEPAIKAHAERYLPRNSGLDDDQYKAFLERAVFFNMTYRTVTGLTGSIFRRAPRLLNAGPKLTKLSKRISKDGLSLELLAKVVAQEQLSVGRAGLLLDKAPEVPGRNADPYLALYTTENILDWTETEIDGRTEYDMILLREFYVDRRPSVVEGSGKSAKQVPNRSYGELFTRLRKLILEYNPDTLKWEYRQLVFEKDHEDADMAGDPTSVSTPKIYGKPFERIPFEFFNATTPLAPVEKPPVLDILTINLSHYRSYADLEQGRFFTSSPIYYVDGAEEDDEFHIGPSMVWVVDKGSKPGLLEFNGHGLKSLEGALTSKENQAAALGGRLIGDSASAGQSDNQIKLKDRNEQSLLLNVTTVQNENFTKLLRLIAEWLNEPFEDIEFRVNQDFLLNNFAAREFRAIHLMWKEGLLPLEVLYEFFLQHEVIPEYITLDKFKELLEDEDQFPNNPDVSAKQEGFADAAKRQEQEQFDTQLEHDEAQAEAARKSAEKVAKEQPKIEPVPAQAKQANDKDAK
ncbi:portal protein [Citromicrobium phage vB_CbaS-RXM]|nr:portal protein [Citromicrobium phage vB_CbaS-RXM]